jgi:EAL and modified HD-GYP domain-containing signal transduction protein
MSAKPSIAKAKRHHVARQPILTRSENVFGYELLFREGVENYFSSPGPEVATHSILDTSTLLGLNVLCGGHAAFINCTRDILLKDYIFLLPPDRIVAEVLETVPPDDEVRAACLSLKKAGYRLALDDFEVNDPRETLVDLADFIKVDIKIVPLEACAALIKRLGATRCSMVAEKVETREDFQAAKQAGFSYFQGYFFCQPELMQTRELSPNRATYLELLRILSRPKLELVKLENTIKHEPSLTYRLLRYLNSARFGLFREIDSVQQALLILGENEVRRWVHLAVTLSAAEDKPSNLVLSALVRASFCELLGKRIKHGESDLFLVGVLSLMDAILEVPMHVVVDGLALRGEARDLLLANAGQLAPIFELVRAYERGHWERSAQLAAQLDIADELVTESHWNAMEWARSIFSLG